MKKSESAKKQRFRWGTGLLVTAAFIGPGTVVTASRAGAATQFQLLWAVLFSVIATCVLQIMAARLGIVTRHGINVSVKKVFGATWMTPVMLGLILLAILYGNSAYQTGNILGAVEGIEILTGGLQPHFKPLLVFAIGLIAIGFIWIGGLGLLQSLLGLLVASMSLLFLAAVFGAKPDVVLLANGLVPRVPETDIESWLLLVVGLIGTTVVPYNLFLHASAAAEQTTEDEASEGSDQSVDSITGRDPNVPDPNQHLLRRAGWDTVIAVGIGGVITASILIAAATACANANIDVSKLRVSEVAQLLVPVVGGWAETVFGLGLLAAGITSAITAPVAAGYCTAGCFGWKASLRDKRVKLVASIVVAVGINVGVLFSKSPSQVILLAQVANGLVLPLMACFLLYALNQTRLMGHYKNGWLLNLLGGAVTLIATGLAARTFYQILF